MLWQPQSPRIAVSGCLSLKLSEKISEPVGHGLLNDVLFTEALSDSILNMA
jgi:hypothetical protein